MFHAIDPADRFAIAFTETVEGFRINRAENIVTADMPGAQEMQRATEMLVTTTEGAGRSFA